MPEKKRVTSLLQKEKHSARIDHNNKKNEKDKGFK